MKTGNTEALHDTAEPPLFASMEPGHEDREYVTPPAPPEKILRASMEPGHEDREYGRR